MKYIVYICMYTYFGVCKYKHVHIFTYMHMYVRNMYLNACVCCMLSINIMAIFTCMSECYTYAFACVYIHILCIDIYWHMYIYNYIYTCTCAGLQRHPLVCFLTATWIEKWNLIFLNTCFNLCGSEDNMRVSGVISFGQRDDAPSKIRFEDFWDFKVFLRVRNPYASFFTIWSQAILEYALKFIPKKSGKRCSSFVIFMN